MNAREREQQFQRRQSAADLAEESGGYSPTSFKTPTGLKRYKFVKDIQSFDVIPFLASALEFKNPKADPGQPVWRRTLGRHKIPDASGRRSQLYLCLDETFEKSCPICDFVRKNRGLSQEWQNYFRSQRRLVLLVNDKPGDTSNPLKLLDAAWYNREVGFGQQLANAIKMQKPEWDYFWDWDQGEGRTVRVLCTDEKWAKIGSISMVKRNYSYPYSLIESAPCLDDCFLVPHPKELDGTPLAQYTKEDWNKVYDELNQMVTGVSVDGAPPAFDDSKPANPADGGGGQRTSDPNPRQEVKQELPAVSSQPNLQQREPERIRQPEPPRNPTPVPNPTSVGTKPSCPYKIGDKVLYNGVQCEVKFVEGGRLLFLIDSDGDAFENVPFAACKPLVPGVGKQAGNGQGNGQGSSHPTPAKVTSQTRKGLDDDDDLGDLDEDEND